MTRFFQTGICLFALLAVVAIADAGNWPRFRGPNGTGEVEDKNVPLTFDNTENMLWKTGFREWPFVADHLGRLSLFAIGLEGWQACWPLGVNTKDGTLRWQTEIPGSKGTIHERNSLASSTRATDGERIYSLFWDGKKIAMYARTISTASKSGSTTWATTKASTASAIRRGLGRQGDLRQRSGWQGRPGRADYESASRSGKPNARPIARVTPRHL